MIDQLISYDQQLFLFLNGMHSPVFDFIMYWLSEKLIWMPLYAWMLFYMWREHRSRLWLVIIFIALLVTFTDQVSVQVFKNIFHRLRPCHNPELEGLVRILNGHCGGKYGFISSHACNMAGIALFSGLMLRKRFRWLLPSLIVWSILIGYSRIYLGVHYPADVVVGFFVGGIIGFLVYIFFNYVNGKLKPVTNQSKE